MVITNALQQRLVLILALGCFVRGLGGMDGYLLLQYPHSLHPCGSYRLESTGMYPPRPLPKHPGAIVEVRGA